MLHSTNSDLDPNSLLQRVKASPDLSIVLPRLRAELKQLILTAANEGTEADHSANGLCKWLLSSEEGFCLLSLVRELLEWAGLKYTIETFDTEVQFDDLPTSRLALQEQVDLSSAEAQPLLFAVLRGFLLKGGESMSSHQPLGEHSAPQSTMEDVRRQLQAQELVSDGEPANGLEADGRAGQLTVQLLQEDKE